MTKCILSLLLMFSLCASGQLKVGEKAPSLQIKKVISKNISPSFYQGKFLVLDFWATWCVPCLASFPYMDKLSKSIKSDNVAFAVMSYEDPEKVQRFFSLKKDYDIDAVKIVDIPDTSSTRKFPFAGKTFQDFQVAGVPQTYIIDPQGVIRWEGYPLELNRELIEGIINGTGQKPNSNLPNDIPVTTTEVKTDSLFIQGFSIKSAIVSSPGMNSFANYEKNVTVFYSGHPLNDILASLFELKEQQVEIRNNEKIPLIRLEIRRNQGSTRDSVANLTTQALASFYGFSYHFENRNVKAYEIILDHPGKLKKNAEAFEPEDAHNGAGIGYGFAFAKNYSFPRLIELLNSGFRNQLFILNEKNLKNVKGMKFDFHFPISSFDESKRFLKHNYGVTIKEKQISMPVLIIDFNNK